MCVPTYAWTVPDYLLIRLGFAANLNKIICTHNNLALLYKTFKTRVTALVAWSRHAPTEFPAIASAAVKHQFIFFNT